MSPPDTDPEKEERRHRPALRGMVLAVVLTALAILAVWAMDPGEDGNEAASGDEEIAD